MATFADVDRIIAKWNGRQCDRDGFPKAQPYQCHDWAAQYSAEIGGPGYLPTPISGGARDVYEQYNNLPAIKAFYERIPNTPAFVPRKGDVMFWGKMTGNIYGHVAVCDGDGTTAYFHSYDQNWANVHRVVRVRHSYSGVLGVLRPRNLTVAAPAPAPQGDPPMNDQQYKDAYNIILQRAPEGPKDGRSAMQFIYDAQGELKVQRDRVNARYEGAVAETEKVKAENAQLKLKVEDLTKQYQDAINKPNEDTILIEETKKNFWSWFDRFKRSK